MAALTGLAEPSTILNRASAKFVFPMLQTYLKYGMAQEVIISMTLLQ